MMNEAYVFGLRWGSHSVALFFVTKTSYDLKSSEVNFIILYLLESYIYHSLKSDNNIVRYTVFYLELMDQYVLFQYLKHFSLVICI